MWQPTAMALPSAAGRLAASETEAGRWLVGLTTSAAAAAVAAAKQAAGCGKGAALWCPVTRWPATGDHGAHFAHFEVTMYTASATMRERSSARQCGGYQRIRRGGGKRGADVRQRAVLSVAGQLLTAPASGTERDPAASEWRRPTSPITTEEPLVGPSPPIDLSCLRSPTPPLRCRSLRPISSPPSPFFVLRTRPTLHSPPFIPPPPSPSPCHYGAGLPLIDRAAVPPSPPIGAINGRHRRAAGAPRRRLDGGHPRGGGRLGRDHRCRHGAAAARCGGKGRSSPCRDGSADAGDPASEAATSTSSPTRRHRTEVAAPPSGHRLMASDLSPDAYVHSRGRATEMKCMIIE